MEKSKYRFFYPWIPVTVIFLIISTVAGGKNFSYTGVNTCRECHGEDAIGNQYKIWASSPHAKAYNTLTGEKAKQIAEKAGIKKPESDTACLACHTTGRGRYANVVSEGVGCEACHGPGEEYHAPSNHVDYNNRENGYRRALKLGMYPILGIERLKSREKLCMSCHREERPCFPESKEEIFRQKITIQNVDSLCKGIYNFRHPLRR